jgi:hypothetical protein
VFQVPSKQSTMRLLINRGLPVLPRAAGPGRMALVSVVPRRHKSATPNPFASRNP